ncbi:hypothetical protein glysoja_038929 [Glycine soja]|uniref:Uncharacterized protein n=1 Tax=Glycine soja TaxID=3848 RepID=A0A0B2S0M9_GLYSO|nr:hypothetical protein glysoja_038929 [Glycine soja]
MNLTSYNYYYKVATILDTSHISSVKDQYILGQQLGWSSLVCHKGMTSLKFPLEPWDRIPEYAKDLIRGMLCTDPSLKGSLSRRDFFSLFTNTLTFAVEQKSCKLECSANMADVNAIAGETNLGRLLLLQDSPLWIGRDVKEMDHKQEKQNN